MGDNRMISKYFFCVGALLLLCAAFAVGAQAAGQAKVLAKIGNQVITDADLKEMTAASPDKSLQTPDGQQKALDYLVNIYVLSAEAQKEGLEKDPEVQRYLNFNRNDLLARVFLEKEKQEPSCSHGQGSQGVLRQASGSVHDSREHLSPPYPCQD